MEDDRIASQILQVVVLALPAIAAYYKLIIEKETENYSFQSNKILNVTYRSLYLFLSVCFIVTPGVLSIMVLYTSSNSFLLKFGLMFMAMGFLSVIVVTHEWYESNLEDFREELDNEKEIARSRMEILDEIKELVDETDFDELSYWEELQIKDEFEELFDEVPNFDYSSDERLGDIASKYEKHYQQKMEELEDIEEDIDDLKRDSDVLPSKEDFLSLIYNPRKLALKVLEYISLISIGLITNLSYRFLRYGDTGISENVVIVLVILSLFLPIDYLVSRWKD